MPPIVASAPGSTQKARPVLASALFNCRCVTPASTVASRSSALTRRTRFIRDRSIETPPLTALTCPSSDDPAPNAITAAPWRAAALTMALTSSVVSGKTTTSGAPGACHDSLWLWCSSCVAFVLQRSPSSCWSSETSAERAAAAREDGILWSPYDTRRGGAEARKDKIKKTSLPGLYGHPVYPEDTCLSPCPQAQQRSRMVSRPQARIREACPPADGRAPRPGRARSADVCTRARRRAEGLALPHLPRHPVQRRQDAAQDACRGALPLAGVRPIRGCGPLSRGGAAVGLDRRGTIHAFPFGPAGHPRAHCRHLPAGASTGIPIGVQAPRRRPRRRPADARAARIPKGPSGRPLPAVQAVSRRQGVRRGFRDE